MTTLTETLEQQDTIYSAALGQGVKTISLDQKITFTRYVRLVLPIDGFVFWVKASIVSPSAMFNSSIFNTNTLNEKQTAAKPITFTAQGSLHYATDTRQDETETYSANRVVFTSEDELQDLNEIAPNEVLIGEFEGVRFAFSTRASFYRQAGLFHYIGYAVYADMDTQVINSTKDFSNKAIVSNSLPIWLAMNNYLPQAWEFFGNSIPLYPSYLLPNNIEPPFASVHVEPRSTKGIAAAPHFSRTMTHTQLSTDMVTVTTYGVRNDQVLDFIDFVGQQSLNTELFGLMNIPVPRDEKRTQNELNIIAQKKTIDFEINYYQTRVNDLARQLIIEAIPSYFVGEQKVA